MLDFPDWADLGKHLSTSERSLWETQQAFLLRYEHYYSGRVFEEFVEKEKPTDDDVPLFPAGINLAKIFCHAQADAMFGDWRDLPVHFESADKDGSDETDKKAIQLVHGILRDSNAGAMFWEADLDRNRYGACAIRVLPDKSKPNRIRWMKVQRDAFLPIWDPEDPDELLETWACTVLLPEQVRLKFGAEVNQERSYYIERWNLGVHQTWLNQIPLVEEINPYGVVPYAFIPRMRSSTWWGDSMIEDIISLQDEINMTVADNSDVIRKIAHPIFWGYNIPAGFSRDVFSTNSDSMWDFGRQVGDVKPFVDMLEPEGNILPASANHIEFLLKMARDHAGTPAIAFGDDNGGGQRSGDTLEIRLRPLEATVRRSRSYFDGGLNRLLKVTAAILKQKEYPGIPARAIDRIPLLVPAYAEILPRDQQAIVDMVVKLLSTDPPTISLETAEVMLGYGVREVDLIKKMLKEKGLWKKPVNDQANLPNRRALPIPGREGQTGGPEDNQGVQPDPKSGGK
jgi:hypothetical protein